MGINFIHATILILYLASEGLCENANTSNKIIGGQEVDIDMYPYQVSFTVNDTYFCGGFIISENYVVTAGHCGAIVEDPSTVVLRAGSAYRENGTIIPIKSVTVHPHYNHPMYDKDVAVMETEEPIEFNDTVQAIQLPRMGRLMIAGTEVEITGWGKTEDSSSTIPDHLMEAKIRVDNQLACVFSYPGIITRNMWCGGNFFFGGSGTCQGDSGGAAVQDGMAVGIVSFGRGCGEPLSPSVFTNIAAPAVRGFIRQQTGV